MYAVLRVLIDIKHLRWQVDLVNEQHIQKLNSSSTEDEMIRSDRDAIISSFVAMFGPGYLSELAYTLMGVNAVITWAKLFKCELQLIQKICAATTIAISALYLK